MVWTVQIGGGTYPAALERVQLGLNEDTDLALFSIDNSVVTRNVVASTKDVTIKFLGTTVFSGLLEGVQYSQQRLKCKVYDKVFSLMDKKEVTIAYSDPGTQLNTILTAIASQVSGVSGSTSITDLIAVQYNRTSCLEAGKYLAQTGVADFWSSGGNTFNIGTRGANKGRIVVTSISRRKIDRFMKRDKVYVRGKGESGNDIEGSYGAGTNVVSFTERKATNVSTLNAIAEYKYNQISKDSSGVRVSSPIEYAYDLRPGDNIVLNSPELNLNGTYRIWRITFKATVAEIEIDKSEELLERYLERQRGLEDIGIFAVTGIPDDPPGAPATPTGLIATTTKSLTVHLGWNPNAEADLQRYQLYRNTVDSSTGSALIASLDSTWYADTNIPVASLGDYYYYWLKSVDWTGNVSASYSGPGQPGVSGLAVQIDETDQILAGLIDTIHLNDEAVSHAKFAISSVWGDVIQASAITWEHIGQDAVGSTHISAASIIANKIAASAIEALHMTVNSIDAYALVAGSVIADKIDTNAVTAIKINAGAVTTNKLEAWAVTSGKITAGQIYGKDIRTSQNVGEGGGPAGIRIFKSGIEAYSGGTTKTFWISSADGKAYFAEGACWINESGIVLKHDGVNPTVGIQFLDDTDVEVGKLILDIGDGISLMGSVSAFVGNTAGTAYVGTIGDQVWMTTPGASDDIIMWAGGNVRPATDGDVDLGETSYRWNNVRGKNFYGTGHWGDMHWSDTECYKCGESFKFGDELKLIVKGFNKDKDVGDEILTVPIHDNCTTAPVMRWWNTKIMG